MTLAGSFLFGGGGWEGESGTTHFGKNQLKAGGELSERKGEIDIIRKDPGF